MGFSHSAIGDNTRENREYLKKLGYKVQFVVALSVDFELIYTWKGKCYLIDKSDLEGIEMSLFINCIDNPTLFQAVTAIRDDNDYMQWFISNEGGEFHLCTKMLNVYSGILCRKATIAELQEYFKK